MGVETRTRSWAWVRKSTKDKACCRCFAQMSTIEDVKAADRKMNEAKIALQRYTETIREPSVRPQASPSPRGRVEASDRRLSCECYQSEGVARRGSNATTHHSLGETALTSSNVCACAFQRKACLLTSGCGALSTVQWVPVRITLRLFASHVPIH